MDTHLGFDSVGFGIFAVTLLFAYLIYRGKAATWGSHLRQVGTIGIVWGVFQYVAFGFHHAFFVGSADRGYIYENGLCLPAVATLAAGAIAFYCGIVYDKLHKKKE